MLLNESIAITEMFPALHPTAGGPVLLEAQPGTETRSFVSQGYIYICIYILYILYGFITGVLVVQHQP